ncbi:hypothetical protein [Nocardioides nanhaiensis]|uniref:hypothetical protein n=1 Tax=Nocardioides nanhaiensis TaxID=1476871 RepID=UPI0031EF5D69
MSAAEPVTLPFAWEGSLRKVARKRVIQCALSRICGVCRASLGRPVAFVGTPQEVARNEFHFPPLHAACADQLCAFDAADPSWQVVTTSGFELVRAGRDDPDPEPRFAPNSLLEP